MTPVLEIILLSYLIFLLWLVIGWWRLKKHRPLKASPRLSYSIIVPFRNEGANLELLITSLNAIDFPSDNFEVVLVNDNSSDDYLNILSGLPANFKVIDAEDEGKKAALTKGIQSAKGDVIVTTDADCIVPVGWLTELEPYFENHNAKLVFGPVAFSSQTSFFEKVQQVEFASLIGSGAATLQWGFPTMCNGANLAFLKSTYEEVKGYSDNIDIPSGDDEFLMHKIYALAPDKVFYSNNQASVVSTSPADSWKTFFNQRKRWASKWKSYKGLKNSLLALLIVFFNLSIIISTIELLNEAHLSLIILLTVKVILEFSFLKSILKSMARSLSIPAFLFLQICYPYYVVLFGLSANFGSYSWKGRKHRL